MLGMHLVGFFGRILLPSEGLSPDLVIPTLTVQVLPPFWAGDLHCGASGGHHVYGRFSATSCRRSAGEGSLYPVPLPLGTRKKPSPA